MIENKARSCKVTIFGESYSLVADESEEHLVLAAKLVDSYMQDIAKKMPHAEEKKYAVLAALRSASKVLLLEADKEKKICKEEDLVRIIEQELVRNS